MDVTLGLGPEILEAFRQDRLARATRERRAQEARPTATPRSLLTAMTHVANILLKLDVKTRTAAATLALRDGLVQARVHRPAAPASARLSWPARARVFDWTQA